MKLSAHFSLEEFTASGAAIDLGIDNSPTAAHLVNLRRLAQRMEDVRALFDVAIQITSAYRNPAVNAAVHGVANSAHALGHAADFHVTGMEDLDAARRIRDSALSFDQLIHEKGRCVHMSFDPRLTAKPTGMRRQVLRQPGPAGSQVFEGLEE